MNETKKERLRRSVDNFTTGQLTLFVILVIALWVGVVLLGGWMIMLAVEVLSRNDVVSGSMGFWDSVLVFIFLGGAKFMMTPNRNND